MGHDIWELPIAFLNKLLFYDSFRIGGRGLHRTAGVEGKWEKRWVTKANPLAIGNQEGFTS